MKCLLILDNAPAHPPGLEDDILDKFKFIKVLYLLPNTTSILQPIDQQVISNFKKLYTKHLFKRCFKVTENTNLTLREFWKEHYNIVICLEIIDLAWQGVTRRTLNFSWRKLWPDTVSERDFEGFEMAELNKIVALGKSMGLEVDEGGINNLVEEHSQGLTTEELQELQALQEVEVRQGFSGEDEVEDEAPVVTTAEIKEVLAVYQKVTDFVEKNHPEKVHTNRAAAQYNDTCLTHFRNILKSRQRQTSQDHFFQQEASRKWKSKCA